ncbi:uncharacterized protein LOC122685584 [Cervus elaphus]|uniref:uncharacterized protein LOC122685584 n=1 Tax=Cervus elaphus TaxID=9860 RepID=UPI001CC32AF1|nr:uncharacterized protein LOC122685584 [Cervus elaphus]
MQPYSEKELVFSMTILPPGRLEAPANLIAWPRLMAPVGIHFQKNAQPSLKVVKAAFAGRRRCVPQWPAETGLGRTRRGGAIGHPRTPAHPRGAWRTRSRVASGEVGAGGTRVRSAPSSGLGQPRGSEAKARRPAQSRSPQPSWGVTVPGGPELTRSSPIRPRPACPHLPPTPPRDCVLCPVLSFRSQDGTFRVSVHTVIAGAAVGTAQKRRGFVGKGLCGLTRA